LSERASIFDRCRRDVPSLAEMLPRVIENAIRVRCGATARMSMCRCISQRHNKRAAGTV
jgi:hypothetical protein